MNDLTNQGARTFPLEDVLPWRVEGGVPALGVDVDNAVYPIEANLQSAVHPNKGCYIGQEVIARLTNKGQAKRRLARLKLLRSADPGAYVIWENNEIGRLTSVARPEGSTNKMALSLLPVEAAQPGRLLSIYSPGGVIMAEVLKEIGNSPV